MAAPSSSDIAAAARVLQDALDGGVDLAIHFGSWTRLQRRALAVALGASEAAYADAKAAASTPPVKRAPAVKPAPQMTNPSVESSPARGDASAGISTGSAGGGHVGARHSGAFGKSPPADAKQVEHLGFATAQAFYEATGRGELPAPAVPAAAPPAPPGPDTGGVDLARAAEDLEFVVNGQEAECVPAPYSPELANATDPARCPNSVAAAVAVALPSVEALATGFDMAQYSHVLQAVSEASNSAGPFSSDVAPVLGALNGTEMQQLSLAFAVFMERFSWEGDLTTPLAAALRATVGDGDPDLEHETALLSPLAVCVGAELWELVAAVQLARDGISLKHASMVLGQAAFLTRQAAGIWAIGSLALEAAAYAAKGQVHVSSYGHESTSPLGFSADEASEAVYKVAGSTGFPGLLAAAWMSSLQNPSSSAVRANTAALALAMPLGSFGWQSEKASSSQCLNGAAGGGVICEVYLAQRHLRPPIGPHGELYLRCFLHQSVQHCAADKVSGLYHRCIVNLRHRKFHGSGSTVSTCLYSLQTCWWKQRKRASADPTFQWHGAPRFFLTHAATLLRYRQGASLSAGSGLATKQTHAEGKDLAGMDEDGGGRGRLAH
ncbi:unnamed protein product [Symbiodinium microadriaticum]|nr:unnamed protein product [Symbiodinium microadriaticum]